MYVCVCVSGLRLNLYVAKVDAMDWLNGVFQGGEYKALIEFYGDGVAGKYVGGDGNEEDGQREIQNNDSKREGVSKYTFARSTWYYYYFILFTQGS